MTEELGKAALIRSLREGIGEANSDLSDLERAAKTIAGSPGDVVSLLARCLSADILPALARRAYQHPNGFAKFVICETLSREVRLRLHVWTADPAQRKRQDEQNVHGHRWNFGSAVIAGHGLRVNEYVRTDKGGTPYLAYRYRPGAHYPDARAADAAELPVDADELEPAGEQRLASSISYVLSSGDTYACGVERLHTVRTIGRAEPPESGTAAGLVATLVVQGPSVLRTAPVYRLPWQPYQAPASPITLRQARSILTDVLQAVAANTTGGPRR
jgi:hypothetical protein